MKYLVTHFRISTADASLMQDAKDIMASLAGDCGYESFMDTDDGIDGFVQVQNCQEIALADVVADFPIEGVCVEYATEEIPDQNWNETWEEEEGFSPILLSDKMVVYDVRHTAKEEIDSFTQQYKIGIQARNAFGTGTHETTQMMLNSVLQLHLEGKRVLDCGCGTGILGIASLMCGAEEVVAYDIDEWSVENTHHNAILNGVGDKLRVLEGDASVLGDVSGTFDVVLANIFREVLIADMVSFCSVMSDNAMLLLSGFYEDDVPLIVEKAQSLGLHHCKTICNGEWRHLVFYSMQSFFKS